MFNILINWNGYFILVSLAASYQSNTSSINYTSYNSCLNYHQKVKFNNQEKDSVIEYFENSRLKLVPDNNYNKTKNKIIIIRNKLASSYKLLNDSIRKVQFLDSAMSIFTNDLLNKIIPYWYETKWDFNGYTAKPNEGIIACGYFVSTTLRDMGLKLNRYRVAQKGPLEEAEIIAIENQNITTIVSSHPDSSICHYLENIEQGLYFVGLDNHVGYLYLKNKNLYFIHSNYFDGEVMIENIENSKVFKSRSYYLSKITGNRLMAMKWLMDENW